MNLEQWFKEHLLFDEKKRDDEIAYEYFKYTGVRLLDVGCGTGRFIGMGSMQLPLKGYWFEGIDKNPRSVEKCTEKGMEVICGDATKMPYDANTFNGIHCSHLIEHLQPERAYALLKEIDRVLKPGKILILRAPMLHPGFYDDFTHVKPYHPKAILHYLNEKGDYEQTTFEPLKSKYKLIKLRYRFAPLFYYSTSTVLLGLGNLLMRFRIHSGIVTGFMLVMQKERFV